MLQIFLSGTRSGRHWLSVPWKIIQGRWGDIRTILAETMLWRMCMRTWWRVSRSLWQPSGLLSSCRCILHMNWLMKTSNVFSRTYKFTCRGINAEDAEAYAAENVLVRKLDKQLDEADHLPIERCYGIAITGKVYYHSLSDWKSKSHLVSILFLTNSMKILMTSWKRKRPNALLRVLFTTKVNESNRTALVTSVFAMNVWRLTT